MGKSDFAHENNTDSTYDAFDLPQHKVRGLSVYLGRRRESSVEAGDREGWNIIEPDSDDDEYDEDEEDEKNPLGVPRDFVVKKSRYAEPIGQAIDLALRMLESQKSIDIMAGVAKRMVEKFPEDVQHITPQSTLRQCKTLAGKWIAKLRRHFFRIQAIDMEAGDEAGVFVRGWHEHVNSDATPTLADYHPHNAGLLEIELQIVGKLEYHSTSGHIRSPVEFQKSLFHTAHLLARQVQRFWVAFLMPKMNYPNTEEPAAVYSDATMCLLGCLSEPSAGHHWEVEFFGGVVRWFHHKSTPHAERGEDCTFGRFLSNGDAFLKRTDRTEQQIDMDSIVGCVEHGEK